MLKTNPTVSEPMQRFRLQTVSLGSVSAQGAEQDQERLTKGFDSLGAFDFFHIGHHRMGSFPWL